jgi:hypothetical protein
MDAYKHFFLRVLCVFCVSCADDFTPADRVDSLRILAVESSPAKVFPNESFSLSAVVANVAQEAVEYRWSLCPVPTSADNGYICPKEADPLIQQFLPGLDASQNTLNLTYSSDSVSLLQKLCTQINNGIYTVLSDKTFACETSYPLQVMLTVRTPSQERTAVRTIRLMYNNTNTRNPPPRILDLLFTSSATPSATDFSALESTTVLKRNTNYLLQITQTPKQPDQNIGFAWYATAGTFDSQKGVFDSSFSFSGNSSKNTWIYDDEDNISQVQFWVIAKDDDGSTSYITRTVEIQ